MKIILFATLFAEKEPESERRICEVCEKLKKYAKIIYLPHPFFASLSVGMQEKLARLCTVFQELPAADIAVSVGGDGTFLRTAAVIGDSGVPVVGINTGRLGFLADIHFNDIEKTFSEIRRNAYDIEKRTLLKVTTHGDQILSGNRHALNEVAIMKQDTSSMLTVHAFINDRYLTSYQSDGLVVATPTGSTAYALSIGGPILAPMVPSFILAAIAPHSLTSRPLVVDNDSRISLKVESRSNNYLISLDGQSQIFHKSTTIEICKADYMLNVVKRKGHTFFETLRDKLMWGKDVRI